MDPLGSEADPYWKRQEADPNPYEQEFNNGIREITIFVLLGILLYVGSYAVLVFWRRRGEVDDEEVLSPFSTDDEIVYKISFAICAFSLAVSVGAALLLPVSTISNEVLHRYPSSWFLKWLNTSLIHGIWNLIFVLSNLSLFVFLPFAYLFCEAEGLPFFGNQKGLIARAKETIVTLTLLALTVLGMMYVIAALIDRDKESLGPLLNVYNYLPFLYSCVSFVGVLMLLIGTPLGFARLFTIVGDLVIKPTFMRNLDEEFFDAKFEEQTLKQKVLQCQRAGHSRMAPVVTANGSKLQDSEILAYYQKNLEDVTTKRESLDRARKAPVWQRMLGYPLVMLFLLSLTAISLLCVILNMGQILAGVRSLPIYQHTVDLGQTSLSTLGVFGVFIEVVLIEYLLVTSIVGLYTIPVIQKIKPIAHNTSLTRLILNCGLFVILSSALPLLSKILGITNFDLLGSFGEVKWLGNFYIILLYNVVFAVAASVYLFNKFTARVRQEIARRIQLYFATLFKQNLDKGQKFGVATTPLSTATPLSHCKTE